VYRLNGTYGTDYERDPALAALDVVGQYARTVTTALEPVTPALWGLEGANTYLPATSARVFELAADEDDWVARYTRLFGVAYVSLSRDDLAHALASGGRVIAEDSALWLSLVRRRVTSRAYLARPRCVPDRTAALALVTSEEFAPPGEAVVECTHPLPVASPEVTYLGQAAIVAYRPERVEVEAVATADALLVLNDAFYPGWTVEVDGQPAELLAANYAVRAVPLPPGAHRVIFSYRVPGLALGAWVSGLALVSSLGAGLAARAHAARAQRETGEPGLPG
jgi:Bacterial membrane protein YfhO